MCKKFKRIKVTIEREYLVPMIDDEITKLDNRTVKQIVKDWFEDWSLEHNHATRDSHRIGGSTKVVNVEVLED